MPMWYRLTALQVVLVCVMARLLTSTSDVRAFETHAIHQCVPRALSDMGYQMLATPLRAPGPRMAYLMTCANSVNCDGA